MKYFTSGKDDSSSLGTIDLSQVLSIAPCDEKGVKPHRYHFKPGKNPGKKKTGEKEFEKDRKIC